jgi:hypothetical protein
VYAKVVTTDSRACGRGLTTWEFRGCHGNHRGVSRGICRRLRLQLKPMHTQKWLMLLVVPALTGIGALTAYFWHEHEVRASTRADRLCVSKIVMGMSWDEVAALLGDKWTCRGRMPPGHRYYFTWELRAGSALVLFDEEHRVTLGIEGMPADYEERPEPRPWLLPAVAGSAAAGGLIVWSLLVRPTRQHNQ